MSWADTVMYVNMASTRQVALYLLHSLIYWITLTTSEEFASSPVMEYCRGEPFHAECGAGEVIMMTSALHGRMRLGRCVKHDYGKLGCQRDVMLQMDSYCSGRRVCNRDRITGDLEFPKCIGELASYLEAAYTCIKVLGSGKTGCRISHNAQVTLPNIATESNTCGSLSRPWVLEVHSSQRVNITLIDMGVYIANQNNKDIGSNCFNYGSIKEMNFGRGHNICGGKDRISHLLTSQSNMIEIYMSAPADIDGAHFLLQFQVLGCEDLNLPSDMWLKRGSGHVIVGCYSSRDTWRLDCVGDTWQGSIGNCTMVEPSIPPVKPEETPYPEVEYDMVAFSNEIGIAAAVVSSVFLSILLLVIGLLYDRRRISQVEREIIQAHVTDEFSWNAPNKNSSPQVNGVNNEIKPHEKTTGVTEPNYQRVSEWCQGQRPPSHLDHIYDTPSYFDLDPDYMAQGNNAQVGTMAANRDSYLQPGDGSYPGNQVNTMGNRDSYLQPMDNGSLIPALPQEP